MTKTYRGNMPHDGEGWSRVGAWTDHDDVEWMVFSKPQEHSTEWMTFKVVANGRAKNKANYWLVKNISTGQLGFARDYVHMRENRADLHAKVESIIKKVAAQ